MPVLRGQGAAHDRRRHRVLPRHHRFGEVRGVARCRNVLIALGGLTGVTGILGAGAAVGAGGVVRVGVGGVVRVGVGEAALGGVGFPDQFPDFHLSGRFALGLPGEGLHELDHGAVPTTLRQPTVPEGTLRTFRRFPRRDRDHPVELRPTRSGLRQQRLQIRIGELMHGFDQRWRVRCSLVAGVVECRFLQDGAHHRGHLGEPREVECHAAILPQ